MWYKENKPTDFQPKDLQHFESAAYVVIESSSICDMQGPYRMVFFVKRKGHATWYFYSNGTKTDRMIF